MNKTMQNLDVIGKTYGRYAQFKALYRMVQKSMSVPDWADATLYPAKSNTSFDSIENKLAKKDFVGANKQLDLVLETIMTLEMSKENPSDNNIETIRFVMNND